MELRHLRYFIAVAERLNFTDAARHLGMAQPPLSIQIRNLEAELGWALFDRGKRQVALTPAGRRFLEESREIVSRSDMAVQSVRDEVEGRAGALRIAYTDGALSERITRRIRKFVRKNRGVRLTIEQLDNDVDLDTPPPQVDALITGFTETSLPESAVSLEKAAAQILVPLKHRLAERVEGELSDFIGESLLISPLEHRTPAERQLVAQIEARQLQIHLLCGLSSSAARFYQGSLGLTCCVCTTLDRGIFDVQRITVTDLPAQTSLAVVPNPRSRAAALALFVKALGD